MLLALRFNETVDPEIAIRTQAIKLWIKTTHARPSLLRKAQLARALTKAKPTSKTRWSHTKARSLRRYVI
jgi:hypothetical protein